MAVFLSVLVHEMGHALAIRSLGVQPWITLYGMGGLTSHLGGRFPPMTQILVSLAGPGAGFAFAAIVVALIKASGHAVRLVVGWPYVIVWPFEVCEFSPDRPGPRPAVREHLVGDCSICCRSCRSMAGRSPTRS